MMFIHGSSRWTLGLMLCTALLSSGCSGMMHRGCCFSGGCFSGGSSDCSTCGHDGCEASKSKWYHFSGKKSDGCGSECAECDGKQKKLKNDGCGSTCGSGCCGGCCLANTRSLAIPEGYPIGSVMRAHFHQMQTNAEAMDFILYQKDFVLESAELTPDGKDKVLEIAARMRSAPFPVIVERTWNNANPELDAHRRAIVSQVLFDLGNTDANHRTFVSTPYGPGKNGIEAIPEFYQHVFMGVNFGNFGGAGAGGIGGGGGVGGF